MEPLPVAVKASNPEKSPETIATTGFILLASILCVATGP
jgi:hypothetical protein